MHAWLKSISVSTLRLSAGLAVGLIASAVLAAGPTTKPAATPGTTTHPTTHPTTRPAARAPAFVPLAEKDSVVVEVKTIGASFRVPNTWVAVTSGGTSFSYDPTGEWGTEVKSNFGGGGSASNGSTSNGSGSNGSGSKRSGGGTAKEKPKPEKPSRPKPAPSKPEVLPTVNINVGEQCHGGSSLPEVAELYRTSLKQLSDGAPYTRDEVIEINGQPVWVLAWSGVSKGESFETRNGKTTKKSYDMPFVEQWIIWSHDNKLAMISTRSAPGLVAGLERVAGQVAATMVWPAAKPTP